MYRHRIIVTALGELAFMGAHIGALVEEGYCVCPLSDWEIVKAVSAEADLLIVLGAGELADGQATPQACRELLEENPQLRVLYVTTWFSCDIDKGTSGRFRIMEVPESLPSQLLALVNGWLRRRRRRRSK